MTVVAPICDHRPIWRDRFIPVTEKKATLVQGADHASETEVSQRPGTGGTGGRLVTVADESHLDQHAGHP